MVGFGTELRLIGSIPMAWRFRGNDCSGDVKENTISDGGWKDNEFVISER